MLFPLLITQVDYVLSNLRNNSVSKCFVPCIQCLLIKGGLGVAEGAAVTTFSLKYRTVFL